MNTTLLPLARYVPEHENDDVVTTPLSVVLRPVTDVYFPFPLRSKVPLTISICRLFAASEKATTGSGEPL